MQNSPLHEGAAHSPPENTGPAKRWAGGRSGTETEGSAGQDLSDSDTALGSEDLLNQPFSSGALPSKVVNAKVKPPIFSPGHRTVCSPPRPAGDREDLLPCQ